MLGYGSDIVNGQLISRPEKQPFAPLTFGQAYTGPRFDSVGSVYNVPPVMAPMGVGTTEAGAILGVQPMPTVGALSKSGGTNFFHPTKSPLPMALIFLAVGLVMLHYIHYGK